MGGKERQRQGELEEDMNTHFFGAMSAISQKGNNDKFPGYLFDPKIFLIFMENTWKYAKQDTWNYFIFPFKEFSPSNSIKISALRYRNFVLSIYFWMAEIGIENCHAERKQRKINRNWFNEAFNAYLDALDFHSSRLFTLWNLFLFYFCWYFFSYFSIYSPTRNWFISGPSYQISIWKIFIFTSWLLLWTSQTTSRPFTNNNLYSSSNSIRDSCSSYRVVSSVWPLLIIFFFYYQLIVLSENVFFQFTGKDYTIPSFFCCCNVEDVYGKIFIAFFWMKFDIFFIIGLINVIFFLSRCRFFSRFHGYILRLKSFAIIVLT